MLQGEREVVRLRPTLASNPWIHLAALGLLGWALVLWVLFGSHGWNTVVVWWQPWTWFVGNDLAAHLWAAIAPVGVGLALGLLAQRRTAMLGSFAAAGLASLFALLMRIPAAQALPVGVAITALLLLFFAEVRRRSRFLSVTNLRLVAWCEFPRRTAWEARHADLLELELHQRLLGRGFDVGTLVAIEAGGARVRFPGVARASRVRALVEALVRDVTATAYLRESQGTGRHVADALAELQRR